MRGSTPGYAERSVVVPQVVSKSVVELGGATDTDVNLAAGSRRNAGRLLLWGKGLSAADSQHTVVEYVGRFVTERTPPARSR